MRESVVQGKPILNVLASTSRKTILTPEFLVEYMEGELEANVDDDLELLFMNSINDRRLLKSLESTKEILKAADEVYLPEDGHFYTRMHQSIMRAIAEESAESVDSQMDNQSKEMDDNTIRQRL